MKRLRDRDALRREAESDRKAAEARAELESRIEEAMDRWAGQIASRLGCLPDVLYPELGYMADSVRRRWGVTLV